MFRRLYCYTVCLFIISLTLTIRIEAMPVNDEYQEGETHIQYLTVGVLGGNHVGFSAGKGDLYTINQLLESANGGLNVSQLESLQGLKAPLDLVVLSGVAVKNLNRIDVELLKELYQQGSTVMVFDDGFTLKQRIELNLEKDADPECPIEIFATRKTKEFARSDLQVVASCEATMDMNVKGALDWVIEGIDVPPSKNNNKSLGQWDLEYDFEWLSNSSIRQHRFKCYIYQLQENTSSRDWYLVHCNTYTKSNNYNRSYSKGVGWFTERRYTKVDVDYYDDSKHHTELDDHEPTSTISSASVSYSIGGGLEAGTGGVGGGGSLGKSWSWSKPDITIYDKTDYYYDYGYWEEKFTNGPKYGWYPTSIQGGPSTSAAYGSKCLPSLLLKTTGSQKGIKCRVTQTKSKMRKDTGFHISWFKVKWTQNYDLSGFSGWFKVNHY